MRLRLAAMTRQNRGKSAGANHAASTALDRRVPLTPDGRGGARGGNKALCARGHGERRGAARRDACGREAGEIGAQTQGKDARRSAQGRRRRGDRGQIRRRGETRRRRHHRRAEGPGELARLRRASRSRPTTPRRTAAGTSSPRARRRPTPPTSVRRRPRRRPRRSRRSAICSPATSMWRAALDAFMASLDRRDNLDRAQDLRGHARAARLPHPRLQGRQRIRPRPRVCFNFSEQLARKTDFAPYVAVSGASNTAISSEDQQICVEGLKHGERYAIVLREGLPSAVGENRS